MITIRLFAGLRDIVGKKDVQVEKSDIALGELLDEFAKQEGDKVKEYLFDDEGKVLRSVMLLINNEPPKNALDTTVNSGQIVSVLLPTAGG